MMLRMIMKAILMIVLVWSALSFIALSLGESFPAHRLVYMATEGSVTEREVYMLHLERRLSMSVTREAVYEAEPTVSPDGQWLIYRTDSITRRFSLISTHGSAICFRKWKTRS